VLDEDENIEVLEIPFEQAWEMIGTEKIKDGKTIMLLQHLKIENVI